VPTDNKRLRCKKCQRQFTRPQGTNRINCFECRPQRSDERSKAPWAQIAQLPVKTGENEGEDGPIEGKLAKLSRIQLEEWDVLDTWQGQAAIALAELIDQGKGGGSGGAATAVKAHREAMQVAHDSAKIEAVDNVTSIFEQGNGTG
jgi:hypothetical protein